MSIHAKVIARKIFYENKNTNSLPKLECDCMRLDRCFYIYQVATLNLYMRLITQSKSIFDSTRYLKNIKKLS